MTINEFVAESIREVRKSGAVVGDGIAFELALAVDARGGGLFVTHEGSATRIKFTVIPGGADD